MEAPDEDIDGVSVGGMDVSDIEDEDHHHHAQPQTARSPPQHRTGPPQAGALRRTGSLNAQSFHKPAPPRFAPRPPGPVQNLGHPMVSLSFFVFIHF